MLTVDEILADIADYGRADVRIETTDGWETPNGAKIFEVEDGVLFGKEFGGCEFRVALVDVVSLEWD